MELKIEQNPENSGKENKEELFKKLKDKDPDNNHLSHINLNELFPEDWDLIEDFLAGTLTIEKFKEHNAKILEWFKNDAEGVLDDTEENSRSNLSGFIMSQFNKPESMSDEIKEYYKVIGYKDEEKK